MENLLIAVIAGLLILLASVASVELGVSVGEPWQSSGRDF